MKLKVTKMNGTTVTHGSGNVFLDLGFEPAEAHIMFMRAELMIALTRHIASKKWTQAEAAKHMGITQPRVSKLKKHAWDEFSLDMLITLATRVGLRTELKLAA
jgi:predicted XRE-type DNA-binding protein